MGIQIEKQSERAGLDFYDVQALATEDRVRIQIEKRSGMIVGNGKPAAIEEQVRCRGTVRAVRDDPATPRSVFSKGHKFI